MSTLDPEYHSVKTLQVRVNCKNCMFFRRSAIYEGPNKQLAPCATLGRQPNSKLCPKFVLDRHSISLKKETPLAEIATVLEKIERRHLPVVAAWVLQSMETKKAGFQIGQTVYIKAYGADYISNYIKARIIFIHKDMAYLEGKNTTAIVKIASLMTQEKWNTKRQKLIQENLIDDPNDPLKNVQKKKSTKKKTDAKSLTAKNAETLKRKSIKKGGISLRER